MLADLPAALLRQHRAIVSILDRCVVGSKAKKHWVSELMDNRDWQSELTESQRTCLRLVGSGMSSKEIAQQTGLSPRTVDQYVNRAAATLGASSRREAARKLATLESGELKKVQLQSEPVAPPQNSGSVEPVSNMPQATEAGFSAPTSAERSPLVERQRSFLAWLPALGGERHDLTHEARLLEIVKAAVISIVCFGSIVAIGAWLHRLFS